jgi:hypothetical protein
MATGATRYFDLQDGSFQGRLQAAYDFLGYGVVVSLFGPGGGRPYYIHRVTPMPLPALSAALMKLAPADVGAETEAGDPLTFLPPDLTQRVYAIGISRTEQLGQPLGVNFGAAPAGTAAANYTRARQSVEFATLPYQIKEDDDVLAVGIDGNIFPNEGATLAVSGWVNTRYISRHTHQFSRVLKIPYGISWVQCGGVVGPKQNKVGFPKREGGADLIYTWYAVPLEGVVPGLNIGSISARLGTINNDTFDSYPAGTLLLDDYKTHEYQGTFGERLANVTFYMGFLPNPAMGNRIEPGGAHVALGEPQGWNSQFDVVQGQGPDYYPVTADQAGTQPIYRRTDFSVLFVP